MPYAGYIILISWVAFILYWAVSAANVKRDTTATRAWVPGFLWRIIAIAAITSIIDWSLLASGAPPGYWAGFWASGWGAKNVAIFAIIGIVLTIGGIAFAIWARYHLGRNWSGRPAMKEGHDLIPSGPYRFVRHPIYAGMIAALLGSGIVGGVGWLAFFVIFTIIFLFRIPKEEGYMMQLFPDQYPAYRARTKALIPGVW